MQIGKIILRQKQSIITQWRQSIIGSYPAESGSYLLENKNKFANPIGFTLANSLPVIVDAVIDGCLSADAKKSLDDIIKIRAVQEFKPSEAIGFVASLRAIVLSEISDEANLSDFLHTEKIFNEINDYTINTYVCFKEKIYDIKANEQLRTFEKMVERLNKKYEELTTLN